MTKKHRLPETITWKAHDRKEHQRSSVWYLGFAAVALGLIIFALFVDRSVMTLITFILMIAVVLLFISQPSRIVTYKLTPTGIHAGNVAYPYKIIKSFWIDYNPPMIKSVGFETTAYLNNKVSLELGDQDPVIVKHFLNQYLFEDLDRREKLSETLARTFKI